MLLVMYVNMVIAEGEYDCVKNVMFCFVGLKILVFSAKTLELKASFRVTTTTSSTTALKSIEFARRGK